MDPGVTPDGELITLTPTDVISLAKYINGVTEADLSLSGCNLIDWSPR